MYRLSCFFFLLMAGAFFANGQNASKNNVSEVLMPEQHWGAGSIMLNDGIELKGMVKYNDRSALISFENGNDSRSLAARQVVGFEFFDEKVNRQRVFYTIEYQDEEREAAKRPYLFEVLKEFKGFAVISKFEPLEVTRMVNGVDYWGMSGTSSKPSIDLVESIFILTDGGEIKRFLKLTAHYSKGMFPSDRKTKSIVDKGVLKQYFVEPGYSKMQEYVKKEDLDMEDREDYLKALTFYKGVTEGG